MKNRASARRLPGRLGAVALWLACRGGGGPRAKWPPKLEDLVGDDLSAVPGRAGVSLGGGRAARAPRERARRSLRVGILMDRYGPADPSHMPALVGLLAELGARVEVIHPAERVTDLSTVPVEHDLYVLKQKTDLALSLAGALHAAGAAILNPNPVSFMLRDRIVTARVLQAAGVPTPETYVAAEPADLAPLLDAGPLIVKPYRGSRGRGIRVVRAPAGLGEGPAGGGPVFAQRYLPHEGRDRKLYVIGGDCFGVKRVFPPTTYADKLGEPFPVSGELAEVARRCGQAFGIDLFGLDVIESGGQPFVVDASSFPGFKGVPDAPGRLASYVYAAAERAARGEPITPPAAGAWAQPHGRYIAAGAGDA